jgi:uncharacterized protein
MPIIQKTTYPGPPWYQINGHWQTILPAFTRKIAPFAYERERLELADGDFLDLDWLRNSQNKLVVLSHGLEGNTDRVYIRIAAQFFAQHGYDVLAWNCRSCSGEMNRTFRLYNHGEIGDIGLVIEHAIQKHQYEQVYLIGYSMGGSISAKYLGANGDKVPVEVKAGLAFSSPFDLKDSVAQLELSENWLYRLKFLRALKAKILIKDQQFPGRLEVSRLDKVKVWKDFDDHFSAQLGGYRDAEDFYQKASAKNFLSGLKRPLLLVNAENDPLLTPGCSPQHIAHENPYFFLENSRLGGHVGFSTREKGAFSWMEWRALEWLREVERS